MNASVASFQRAIREYQEQANFSTKLLSLPAELRIAIYALALPDRLNDAVFVTSRDHIIRPPILRVSRQIRKEAAAIWYSKAVFIARFEQIPAALAWLKALPMDAIYLLRHLHLSAAMKCHCETQRTNGLIGLENVITICVERYGSGQCCAVDPCEERKGRQKVVQMMCPTSVELQRRVEKAVDQVMLGDEERGSIEREHLLDVVKILDDAQTKTLKLCMGRSAWLR